MVDIEQDAAGKYWAIYGQFSGWTSSPDETLTITRMCARSLSFDNQNNATTGTPLLLGAFEQGRQTKNVWSGYRYVQGAVAFNPESKRNDKYGQFHALLTASDHTSR